MTDTKMCPYCGEDVKFEAIKCKHCQSMLSEEDNALVGAAAPAKPRQAAPQSTKPIWKRWWAWAAVIIIFFIAILSIGNGDDKASPAKDAAAVDTPQVTEPEPATDTTPEMQFISINEITTFAEWGYKVIDVQYHNTLGDERARGTYAVFMLEATNNSNVPRQIGHMFQVEDDKGRVFAFDSYASLAHYQAFRDDTWHLEDIGASFTAIMPIAFDIPDDAEVLFFYPGDIRDEEFKETSVIMVTR